MGERALRLVDPETGEITEQACAGCLRKDDELRGLQRDVRAWAIRYAQLARDKDAEAQAHRYWPQAIELFGEWKTRCRHPRSKFTADDFYLVLPFLKEQDGYAMCLRAIAGAEHDPFTVRRKNGSVKRFDDFGLIFRDRQHFEDFANRAPREGVAAPRAVS